MTFVIHESQDGTERGITSREQWLDQAILRLDSSGNPMQLKLEFEAATWEEAMHAYNNHYGYGRHVPME